MEVKGEYEIPAPVQSQENPYELVDFNTNVRRNDDSDHQSTGVKETTSKQSMWSKPLVIIAILLCLIVLLLVVILGLLLVQLSARDVVCTSAATTGAIADNNGYPNFTQWANDIVSRVNGSFPDFDEWANGVVSKVNSSVTGSLPDFDEWANGVVSKVNSSVTGSLPDFDEWANSVVSKVNSCNMGSLCGSGGGWTRLAYLDMSNATVNCPSGFRLYQSGGVRACGRPATSSGSCVSVQFSSDGISYSQVCGRVTGYQYGSPDALHNEGNNHRNDINSSYIDGVSITRGSSRQHVWSLIAGYSETISLSATNACPCNAGSTVSVPSFIGSNYFCESGSRNNDWSSTLYTSDPLWDGQGCGHNETACCNVPGIPWFHRDYGSTTTTDYIELRVCGDEGTTNEDVPVSLYEIYVK